MMMKGANSVNFRVRRVPSMTILRGLRRCELRRCIQVLTKSEGVVGQDYQSGEMVDKIGYSKIISRKL